MKSLLIFAGLGLCLSLPPCLAAQEPSEQNRLETRLRQDQQSILLKAERLRGLMTDLRARYVKEDRKRHVDLLDKGLEHLKTIGLLETVASVRDSLDARALSQANQKAAKVVKDLEALLQILLDRPSMEKIEEEIQKTRKMQANAAELERRQKELIQKNRETSRQSASKTERDLVQQMRNLARLQEEEAVQNRRDAGNRQPFLEDALRRIDNLLAEQKRLEVAIRKKRENPDAPDPARQQAFDLGALKSRTMEQLAARSRQRGMERVAEDARRLQRAANRKDSADIQDARDELRNELARATEDQQGKLADELGKLAKELEGSNKDLEALAKKIEDTAARAAQSQQANNNKKLDELKDDAKKLSDGFKRNRKAQDAKPGRPEADLEKAAKALEQAAQEGRRENKTQRTQSRLSQALRKLEEARAGIRRRNPDPKARAGRMATESAEVARQLRESPGSDPEKKKDAPAENKAARDLDRAENELRDAAEKLQRAAENEQDRDDPQQQKAVDQKLEASRQNLERAKQALQQELARSGRPQQAREQAAKRQEQLAEEAQRVRDRMQQAQRDGDLSEQQQKAADRAMKQAQQQMQKAQQSLRKNRQSQAARQQEQAADALDKATEEMQRNRPLNQEQKDQLKQQAKKQKQLAEDIMNLAKLAEERKNRRAQQALDEAAKAAQEAAEELDQGNDDEAERKQEEAREKLEEAQKSLEEERERYEDLRQEELLFKIAEELKQLLAKQKPITKKTEEAQKALADKGRLSRRSRRRLNELGDEEQELGAKAKFMREALEKEAVLVFSHALKANEQDLAEVKKRLSGRRPEPDELTVVLQKDVEDRTEKLLEALKREQRRRQQQQKQQQQQQQDGDRKNPQKNGQNGRRRLVSLTAELEMLKQMEEDMLRRTGFMEKLIRARGEKVTELDLALLERLAHRHNRVTEIFLALKKQVEQAINPPPEEGEEDPGKDDGRGK